ncbi:hypothetical protein PMAYCL1PPCAC_16474, partial [Pristionchus mayeri]
QELFTSNVSSFYEIFRYQLKESFTMLHNVFDEFEHLSIQHKITLFKNFIGKFTAIEGIHYSANYFTNNFKLMTSLMTCIDLSNLEGWISDADIVEMRYEFRAAVRSFSHDYHKLEVPMVRMDDFTEREFHALIILAYCDLNPSLDLPEEIFHLATQTKSQLLAELQEYYRKELNLKDLSHRLGTLLTFAQGA